MTKRAYYRYMKKWRKRNPHYSRDWMRRQKFVVILGVKCKWRYLP